MNYKGVKLLMQSQLDKLRSSIQQQEAQLRQMAKELKENKQMEAKLSALVEE